MGLRDLMLDSEELQIRRPFRELSLDKLLSLGFDRFGSASGIS